MKAITALLILVFSLNTFSHTIYDKKCRNQYVDGRKVKKTCTTVKRSHSHRGDYDGDHDRDFGDFFIQFTFEFIFYAFSFTLDDALDKADALEMEVVMNLKSLKSGEETFFSSELTQLMDYRKSIDVELKNAEKQKVLEVLLLELEQI